MRGDKSSSTATAGERVQLKVWLTTSPKGKGPKGKGPKGKVIHPGVQTSTHIGRCTSNFIFADSAGEIYLGTAAHCFETEEASTAQGCEGKSLPLGAPVKVGGASQPGTLAYSSWLTMRANRESVRNACVNNDFALIRLDPVDRANVDPTVPVFGGPTRLGATTAPGDKVYAFGNSGLRQGVAELSPQEGLSMGQSEGGWTHTVYLATPAVPGDSGSAVLSADGAALGTMRALRLVDPPGADAVSDLTAQFDYLKRYGGFTGIHLVRGTDFVGGALP